MAKGLSDGDKLIPTPVVIPAKAGIQEWRPGSEKMAGFIGYPRSVVIPALREWLI